MNKFHMNIISRYFHITPVNRIEPSDPIQALFLKYVREYFSKLKESKGVLFDVSPELEKDRLDKYKALGKQYFGDLDPSQFEKFPEFKFEEPQLDGINLPELHPFMKKQ